MIYDMICCGRVNFLLHICTRGIAHPVALSLSEICALLSTLLVNASIQARTDDQWRYVEKRPSFRAAVRKTWLAPTVFH